MYELLLVEDDLVDALFVARLLEGPASGSKIDCVSSLREGIAKLHAQQFDAVILDLNLPDSRGIETLLAIRNRFPQLPVVVLTGNADEALGVQSVECGAQDYVAKSMVAGELLARIVRFSIARNKQILFYKSAARTDALTGLGNRRALDEHLQRMYAEFVRYGNRFTLLMLDIDHFKKINDQHGHRTGDYVLTEVAQVLLRNIRQMDVAARFGGEEFSILLSQSTAGSAERVAQRMLRDVAAHAMSFERASLSVQVSIGLAECSWGIDPNLLLEQADQALYAAKRNGRNQGCYSLQGEVFYITPAKDDMLGEWDSQARPANR